MTIDDRDLEGEAGVEREAARELDREIDLGELLARLEYDRDLLRDVLDIFTEEFPVLHARLRQALTEGAMREVRVTAHTLKGMLASLSLGKASAAAMRVERMAAEFTVEGMVAEIDRMEAHAAHGREQLVAACREVGR
jgi:HPt (histidine-containing phosphotransfer) domain-containing protein